MKLLLPLVFAATTAVSGVAHAATYSSDADRRTQNREEALTKWRASNGQTTSQSTGRATLRTNSERPTVRERTRNGTQAVKGFTHRQAETVRNFGERQDRRLGAKFGKRAHQNANPDGGGGK